MAGGTESREGTMRRGRERSQKHTHPHGLPLQQGTSHTSPSVLSVKNEGKFCLNILLCSDLLLHSLRQALRHSNVSRGDTVACTTLPGWTLGILSSREIVANQLFQSQLDWDIL